MRVMPTPYWAGSQLHWFPGNHLLHLHQSEYLYRMKAFMDHHCGLGLGPDAAGA